MDINNQKGEIINILICDDENEIVDHIAQVVKIPGHSDGFVSGSPNMIPSKMSDSSGNRL